jgi:hypothetical protein
MVGQQPGPNANCCATASRRAFTGERFGATLVLWIARDSKMSQAG